MIALAMLALASCARKEADRTGTIEYVREIISGADSGLQDLVRNYNEADRSKSIFVAGPMDRSVQVLRTLQTFDRFDNVDGRIAPDGLPDFSGETVCAVYDMDFEGVSGNEALRRAGVRSVLQTMDTTCFVSPYDKSGLGRKPAAKIVLLASPQAAVATADIDTLFTALGCTLPVISPLKLALERFFARKGAPASILVISDEANASGEAYNACAALVCKASGIAASSCFVRAQVSDHPLLDILNEYSASGADKPADLLIIDNPEVDPAAVRADLATIRSVMNEESLLYGNLISKDFHVADLGREGAEECYRALRKQNLFTHKVAYPKVLEYMSVSSPADSISEMLLQYNPKYLY